MSLNALVEDKKIAEVKATTALKNDGIPFMLLPVRIETRFMEVDQASIQDGMEEMDSVLDSMLYVQVNLLQITTQTQLNQQLSSNVATLTTITGQVKLLTRVSGQEKDMLQQMVKSFNDVQAIFALRFTAASYATLTAAVTQLDTAVKNITIYPSAYLTGAEAFLYELQKNTSGLKQISDRKTLPYQNIKNKKSLYTFIDATLQSALDFYTGAQKQATELKYLSKTALAKIELLHSDNKNSLSKIGNVLQTIYPNDAGWLTFMNNTVNPRLSSIGIGGKAFGTTTVPFLKTLPEPPAATTRELMFTGIKAMLAIQKFKAKPNPKFEDLKLFRTSFSGKMDFINKAASQPLMVSNKQQSFLTKIYTDLGASFDSIKPTINAFPVKNYSQSIGRDMTSEYLNPDNRQTIGSIGVGLPAIQLPKVHELWVRIYPDDIFVHTHEEALTTGEIDAGKSFWNAWWAASNDEDTGKAAWAKICTAFGSRRASWIANVLNPIKFVTPKNTASIAAKPFINLLKARDNAKTLYTQIENTNLAAAPATWFANTSLATLNGFSTSLQNIKATVNTFTNTPTFFIEAIRLPMVRIEGDLQVMRSKADKLTAQQKTTYNDKLIALSNAETEYKNLVVAVNALIPLTIEDYLTKVSAPFDFPSVTQKQNSWTKAPYTYMLPERFVVITMQGNSFSHVMVSNPVVKDLQLGPNPELFTTPNGQLAAYHIDDNGDLVIEEGLRWLADYPEAVKKGMGVTIPLTKQQYDNGFTKLFVLGVKEADAANSAKLVEKLFTNHVYSADGMTLLKIGTPTNNTEQAKAGFSRTDKDNDERYAIEVANKTFSESETDPLLISDAKRLGNALGISLPVMQKVNNKTSTQISNAYATNRALWHATIGHTMEEMWEHVFTYDNIRHTEDFFTKFCLGRGILPSIRVGMQPYGFLTTTAYSRFQFSKDYNAYNLPEINAIDLDPNPPHPTVLEQKKLTRYHARLQELLRILNNYWTSIRNQKVLHYENLSNGDPQKNFVEMLGLSATSVEYYNRYSVNIVREGLNSYSLEDEYNIRSTHGSDFVFDLVKQLMLPGFNAPSFVFDDENMAIVMEPLKRLAAKYSRIVTQIEDSRIFRGRFMKPEVELKELNGAVINGLPLSTTIGLEKIGAISKTYIEWLLDNNMDTVLAGNNPENFPSRSLLFLLMRQSLMQANQEAALNILQFEKLITPELRRIVGDEETYDTYTKNVQVHTYNTKWHLLLKDIDKQNKLIFKDIKQGNLFYDYLISKINGPDDHLSMAMYMNKPATNSILNGYANVAVHKQYITKVDAVRAAFTRLNTIPTAELNFLLAEHLDVCSYRIDAWMTGMAAKRLAENRAIGSTSTGIHIGAYGWVENLQRDTNKTTVDLNIVPDELKPDADTKLYKDPDNGGFIHAPSINHAVTAAVLRSAYKSNSAEEDINNRLSVNISSSRVRMALNLIDGVQSGLSIGALLGFQFEKGLHERYQLAELDKFILPFRKMFPLVVPVKDNAQQGKEPAFNTNVVNGTSLLNKIFDDVQWMDFPSKDTLFKVLMDKKATLGWLTAIVGINKEYEQVAREIDRMADAFDALGDLAVSESVYQIINGNYIRAAAMVNSLASGKNIPDPQIVETVRTGTIVTQRVLMNLEVKTSFVNPPNWAFGATCRAKAEPSLNHWLAGIIGNPASIKSIVTYKDANIDVNQEMLLSELKIQPIDCLFLWASEADVKAFIEYNFRKKFPALPTNTVITVDIKSRVQGWAASDRTFSEAGLLMQELRNLLQVSKPAGADSYTSPTTKPNELNPGYFNDASFGARLNTTIVDMKAAITNVTSDLFVKDLLDKKKVLGENGQPAALTLAQLTLVTNFLLASNLFGIANSIPRTVFNAADDLVVISKDLFAQALVVYTKLKQNITAAEAVVAKITATTSAKDKVNYYMEGFRLLFGKLFLALPIFQSQNAADISKQLLLAADKSLVRNSSFMVMQDWMCSVSKVRKAMNALQMVDLISMGMNKVSVPLAPAQLPYQDGDYWAGTEYPEAYSLNGDKLSMVMVYPEIWQGAINTQRIGLVLDEWMEIIPNKSETTGITLNYNQPNATAPQTILMAVTPVQKGKWDWEDLVYTLIDTLEMAKNRAVEPDHLQDSPLSHILPTILSEVAPPQTDGSNDVNVMGVQAVMDFDFNREQITTLELI